MKKTILILAIAPMSAGSRLEKPNLHNRTASGALPAEEKTNTNHCLKGKTKTQKSFAHSGNFSVFRTAAGNGCASPAVMRIKTFGLKHINQKNKTK